MDTAPENGQEENHALPPAFVGTLFAALLGALVPGIFMTLVSAPGQAGSPIYGLLLPWSMLPFLLAIASGWLSRRLPEANALRIWTIVAAVMGLVAYTYFMLFDPRGVKNIKVFLYLPLWQWLLMSRSLLRALLAVRRGA